MDKDEAIQLFERIRTALPHLSMDLRAADSNVDASMAIPVQSCLSFAVHLYLDSNALHMTAGEKLWLEWFPPDNQTVVEQYRDAALGVLSGEYRIVEYFRGTRAVKALLQRPNGDSWETIGTSGGLGRWRSWGARVSNVLQASRA